MKHAFINKDTFNEIIEQYISKILLHKQRKTLINLDFLNEIKEILLNVNNKTLSNKNMRDWVKKKFKLEEITPGDYRVIVKANNNPVLVVENMYEVLCHTHAEITQHGGQKQTWKSVSERWGWIKQCIIEKFVNNCTICAVRKPSFHPLAAKPIIAKNFLSRVQVNVNLYYIYFVFTHFSIYNNILFAMFNLFYNYF
jgi:hypothetical protein